MRPWSNTDWLWCVSLYIDFGGDKRYDAIQIHMHVVGVPVCMHASGAYPYVCVLAFAHNILLHHTLRISVFRLSIWPIGKLKLNSLKKINRPVVLFTCEPIIPIGLSIFQAFMRAILYNEVKKIQIVLLWRMWIRFYSKCQMRQHTVVCAVHRAHSIGSEWHNLTHERTQIHTAFQWTGSFPLKRRHTADGSILCIHSRWTNGLFWIFKGKKQTPSHNNYEFARNIDCCAIVQWNFLREFRLKSGIERCSGLK